MIKILKGNEFSAQVKQDLFARSGKLQEQVAEIIHQVTRKGDQALLDYTSKFDRVDLEHLRVPQSAIKAAGENLTPRVREIITSAIENIQDFHKKQVTDSWKVKKDDGTVLGQIVRPIDRVGVYIPGGRAVYPSTLLMNVIPAQIAGVESIVAVSPPMKNGLPNELVLAGCALLGVEEVYAIGGAHSIAALAFGTDTIKPVCKITGPGNQYVAEAKRQVFGTVGIDSVAGPSEILILHDDLTIPVEYLVRDMLSQAEHDAEASSILVTTSQETAESVKARLEEIVPDLPRRELIQPSLENHGAIIVVDEIDEGIEISNLIAPEHLEVLLQDESKIDKIRNAGAIFVGRWSSEPVGDYFAGPNHTIPTSGAAKYASPLGVADFVKQSSYIKYSEERLRKEGEMIAEFADLEELHAHAEAIRVRLNS